MNITYAKSRRGVVHVTLWGGQAACGIHFGSPSPSGEHVYPLPGWEITRVEAKKITTPKQIRRIFKGEPCKRCFDVP